MCGIAGYIYLDPSRSAERTVAEEMCRVIHHRGPDENGFYVNANVAMGMQRLSIIDLEGGTQPIHNEDKSVWIVYNGEVYNFPELTAELKAKGHRFYTHTDTECLVHLYEEYGESFVEKLRGMFGFAIWDDRKKKLVVARDRLGIKPIYYSIDNGRFLFASEMKSILAAGITRTLDTDAMNGYFVFNYVPSPLSIFKEVRKLLPGHMLVVEGGKVRETEYWDLDYRKKDTRGFDELKEELMHLLTESVRIRLRSDVPFGAFLSGGIDSSTVVALMSSIMEMPVKTFSIGFEEPDYNELDAARIVAEKFQTEHHELVVRPDMTDIIPRLVHQFDEPFGDVSSIPTYLVSKLAREHVTMVLSGDGGDELFAGYTRYPKERFTSYYSMIPGAARRGIIRPALAHAPLTGDYLKKRIDRFLMRADLPPVDRYRMAVGIFSEEMKREIFRGIMDATPKFPFDEYFFSEKTDSFIDRLLYTDTKTYLPDDILTKVDRMSMANSLESRVPILDHKVVEFAASIPDNFKLKGFNKKYIFKEAARTVLPDEIIDRKKKGFGVPLAPWFRGQLKDFAGDVLTGFSFRQKEWFNHDAVESMFNDHLSGARDYSEHIWTLIVFELWSREFLGAGTSSDGR